MLALLRSTLVMADLNLAWLKNVLPGCSPVGLAASRFCHVVYSARSPFTEIAAGVHGNPMTGGWRCLRVKSLWREGYHDGPLWRCAQGAKPKSNQENCNQQTWLLNFRDNGRNCSMRCIGSAMIRKVISHPPGFSP